MVRAGRTGSRLSACGVSPTRSHDRKNEPEIYSLDKIGPFPCKTYTREDRNMQRSMTRIRTSHVGRLPPPKGWEDMPGRLASAEITEPAVIAVQVTPAIAETVRRQ